MVVEFHSKHLPQVIDHHCGLCEHCDPQWCQHRAIQITNPSMSKRAHESKYFGEGQSSGSRFTNFLDISDVSRDKLKAEIRKRFSVKALMGLRLMLTNNNVERLWTRVVKFNQGKRINTTLSGAAYTNMLMAICENNDGFTWLDELDERLDILSLAHDSRSKRQHQNHCDKLRKRLDSYAITRKEQRKRKDLNQGKSSEGGWKHGKYKPDSVRAGSCGVPKKKRKRSSDDRPTCSRCAARDHITRLCVLPRMFMQRDPVQELAGAAAIWEKP